MSGAPLGVPASPASSKRSRSRDSSATSSLSTPAAGTSIPSPTASVPNLVIPFQNFSTAAHAPQDPIPYPAFLRLTRPGSLDWEERKRLTAGSQKPEAGQQLPWARCSDYDTLGRNRYANVEPYERNRVKLQVPEGHCDYINASPIVLESTKSETVTKFIATQGPKSDLVSHMWRMVWHETASPAVIVMLTQTHEAGREKCFPYYPASLADPVLNINEEDEFEDSFTHNVKLIDLTKHDESCTEIRELEMAAAEGSEAKKIWHLLYTSWPDFSVPEGSDREALLNLVQISREKLSGNLSSPRIVHCSAGVGRSGTFIALDWLAQELEDGSLDNVEANDDPVFNVVDKLRQQRMMMVQAESQYALLYDVIRARWRDRWIRLHPEEAERLGLSTTQEPKAKKPRQEDFGLLLSEQPPAGDENQHAELEAELINAEAAFEQGKR
ncbi:hypothetical protein M011DRAFT_393329 [Sporormia fimetaria CBS 119925]|uniref:Phosphatases II n=1 Tax=Sporormia fimetaria CBS 119925 TaxID=1340428 RepID=A0A6A6VQX5_9PLEO|nr:hypothetical protein M011DRAFT_393329 [Sporormia fimetaria CBS 119925]